MPAASGTRYVRRLYPGDAPPIENAVVEWEAGRIVRAEEANTHPGSFEEVAVVPRLINLHTHLEFQSLRTPLPEASPFPQWISDLLVHRAGEESPLAERYHDGIEESRAGGVGTVCDIATQSTAEGDLVETILEAQDVRLIRFLELIGLTDERIADAWDKLNKWWVFENWESAGHWTCGLSPHAPYTVRYDFFAELTKLAASRSLPVAVHWAETIDERELIEEGRGPLRDMLTDFGLWSDSLFQPRPLGDYLRLLTEVESGLVIHANHANDDEIAFLAGQPHLTVVYCPRTQRYFGHPPHPWLDMLEAGVRVGLGTDSRASNPNISVWEELRFLSRIGSGLAEWELLRLATASAADALHDPQRGRLCVGAPAEFVSVSLSDTLFTHDPLVR